MTDKDKVKLEKLTERRRRDGACRRCGNENDRVPLTTCSRCKEYQSKYRASLKQSPVVVDEARMDVFRRRIESLEISVARLQLSMRDSYLRGYRRGHFRGSVDAIERDYDRDDYKSVSFQEYAAISNKLLK